MTKTPASGSDRPAALTREHVVRAGVELADRDGLDGLSMRRLGPVLGVDPMALYRHVRDKDDLLDGMRDAVLAEIPFAPPAADWQVAMRTQVQAARAVMLRHPWMPRLLEDRADGMAIMAYVDGILGILAAGGFAIDLAHHVLHVFGSRILGFTQDLFDDGGDEGADPAVAAAFARSVEHTHPHVARLAVAVSHDGGLGGCDDDSEFAFGLDLMLDGFERLRAAGPA